MAKLTGISPTMIFNLQKGSMEPSFEVMEKIAKSLNKKPSYFLEYRIGKIMASLSSYLVKSPEIASMWYSEISKNEGIKIK
jgi:transcriptional regulator with XRE-family HTH domain